MAGRRLNDLDDTPLPTDSRVPDGGVLDGSGRQRDHLGRFVSSASSHDGAPIDRAAPPADLASATEVRAMRQELSEVKAMLSMLVASPAARIDGAAPHGPSPPPAHPRSPVSTATTQPAVLPLLDEFDMAGPTHHSPHASHAAAVSPPPAWSGDGFFKTVRAARSATSDSASLASSSSHGSRSHVSASSSSSGSHGCQHHFSPGNLASGPTPPSRHHGATSGVLRVASDPPVLSNLNDSAVRLFRAKWATHLQELGDAQPHYSPLDYVTQNVRDILVARVTVGSLPPNFLSDFRPAESHLSVIDQLFESKHNTWNDALSALQKPRLPAKATFAAWDRDRRGSIAWTKALHEAQRHDDRPAGNRGEKPYLNIFLSDYLHHHKAIAAGIKARGATLREAYDILARSLRTLDDAKRIRPSAKGGDDDTKPGDNDTNTTGTGTRGHFKPMCYVCGKEGHRFHECTTKKGPWKFINKTLQNTRDPSLKAKFPNGLDDVKAARGDPKINSMVASNRQRPSCKVLIHHNEAVIKTSTITLDSYSDVDVVSNSFVRSLSPAPTVLDLPSPERIGLGDNESSVTFTKYVVLDIALHDDTLTFPIRNRIPFRIGNDQPPRESPLIMSFHTTNLIGAEPILAKHKVSEPLRDSTVPLRPLSNTGSLYRMAASSLADHIAPPSTGAMSNPLADSSDTDPISDALFNEDPSFSFFPPIAKKGERPPPMDPPIVHGEQDELVDVIDKHKHIFSRTLPHSPCSLPPLKLRLKPGCELPPPAKVRRTPPPKTKAIARYVTDFLDSNVIRPSTSPFAMAIVAPPKPGSDGFRFCLDTTPLNQISFSQANPLPLVDELIASCRGSNFFCSIDLSHAYFQFAIDPKCTYLCAFVCHLGLFEFLRVIQGLHAAAPHVQSQIRWLFRDCPWVLAYLDDILLKATSRRQLAQRLDVVLTRLSNAGFVLNALKCKIGVTEVKYLGFIVDGKGHRPGEDRVKALISTPAPRSVRQLKRFLGALNFLRSFIQDFSRVALPLTELTKKHSHFKWSTECQDAFTSLKDLASKAPVLRHFDPSLTTVLRCDASSHGIGAVLLQTDDPRVSLFSDELHPVAYFSEKFNETQQRWPPIEQECYSIFRSVNHWAHYLSGINFILQNDHRNLVWMRKSVNAKVQRWFASLIDFRMSIAHIPGKINLMADMLSRSFDTNSSVDPGHSGNSTSDDGHVTDNVGTSTSTLFDGTLAAARALTDERIELLDKYHNSTVGHGGVHRTEFLLRLHGHSWKGMTGDIKEFISLCQTCNINTPGQTDSHSWGRLHSGELFESFSIDFVGPFTTPDNLGRKYILTCICDFSRFIELVPCRDKSAESVATALLQIFGRYGSPRQIRRDNAKEFDSKIVTCLLKYLSSCSIKSIPYSPKSNGKIERSHRELTRHIRDLVFDKKHLHVVWADILPIVQRIFNARVNRSTGVAPVILVFAGQVTPDRFLLRDISDPNSDDTPLTPPEYISNILLQQSRVLDAVAEQQEKTYKKRQRSKYNPTMSTSLQVGDFVMLSYINRPPSKLSTKLRGPFRIVSISGCCTHVASLLVDKIYKVDISRLKKWTASGDPTDAARKAEPNTFVPEAIIDCQPHALKPNKPDDYLFLTTWEGFEPADATWQELKDVRHLDIFQDFISDHQNSLPKCLKDFK